MTRKLWVLATVTLFGVSAVLTGVGLTRNAEACDEAAKSAAATSSSSCCAKDGAKSASADGKKVNNSMIKSAMFAPGAAPIMNAAAFGAMMAGGADCAPCDWCPEMSTAAVNAKNGACTGATQTASLQGSALPAGHPPVSNASAGHPGCNTSTASVATIASYEGCSSAKTASATMAAGGEGCSKPSASATGSGDKAAAGCCEGKTASAAGSDEKCSTAKTASLKGKVDEMPYRENKKVVLAGSYACGHCTLQKTEDCAPMIKTADGKVYPLLQNHHATEMKSKEGKNLEVSGSVKKVDGVKFLEVKSYKVL